MKLGERTPELVIVLTIVALAGGALLLGGGSEAEEPASDAPLAISKRVGVIAERVEAIRGVPFRRRPVPREVTAAQARREGLAELDRVYSPERREADEDLLALLGLIEPGADLREIEASVYEEEVAGFYDIRKKRLALVRDAAGADPALAEIVLAHELVHALEDERFGLKEPVELADDETSAYRALVEGSATAVMDEYARLHISAERSLGLAVSALGAGGADLPPYIRRSLEFSYLRGQEFVERVHGAARGWRLVNFALVRRPPRSTEQIMHPEKYLRDEQPEPVLADASASLRQGWRRLSDGSVGEFDTAELLRLGDEGAAPEAAAGWSGGRYELWRRGPGSCATPCRARGALLVAWRFDTEKDAREFAAVVPRYLERGLRGRRAGRGRWSLGRGAAAFRSDGQGSALAMAPDAALANRLAAGAVRRAP